MRTRDEVSVAMTNARRAWKDTGDPIWAHAEGVLAWVLDNPATEVLASIVEVMERDPRDRG